MKVEYVRKLRLDLDDIEVLAAEEMNVMPYGGGVFSKTGFLSCVSYVGICNTDGDTDDPTTPPPETNVCVTQHDCGSQQTGCSCYTICFADTRCQTV
jgi:hypothetical protein